MVKIPRLDNRLMILGVQSVVFIAVAVALYVASAYFVQSEFSKIEVRDIQKDTAVAVDTLDSQVSDLSVKTADWSQWDDTYRYIVDHNQAYAAANLTPNWLISLRINYMLFYDLKHRLVHAMAVDDSGNVVEVPTQLLAYFSANSVLFCDHVTDLHKGYLNLPAGLLLFVSQPILTSNQTGPSHGTIIFAENLSVSRAQQIAAQTHLNLGYYRLSALPADAKKVPSISTSVAATQVLSQNQIAGYRMVDDAFGQPLFVARVLAMRDVFIEAQRTLLYFVGAIAIVTLFAIILMQYITSQLRARDRTIRLKNDFFSIASHEIRTPLAAIKGNSSMLLEMYGPKNDETFVEIATDIHTSSTRLIQLVTGYLDVARLEQGKVPMIKGVFTVSEVVESVVQEMQGLAADHNIYIRVEAAKDIPLVWGDPDRIKQVVYNLIGNAAKFTETGGITVSCQVEGRTVRVFITDTGRGIAPDSQKLLFRKFQQAKVKDSSSGAGLGLYISKMLINLMGGEIRLDSSQLGKGTTISFTVPIARPSSATTTPLKVADE